MATPSYRSGIDTEFNAATTNWVVTKPAGVAIGDLLLCMLVGVSGIQTPSVVPTGWTKLDGTFENTSDTTSATLWWKIAVASDVSEASYQWTLASSSRGQAVMVCIEDVDTVDPFHGYSMLTQSVASANFPISLTPDENENLLVGFWGCNSTTGASFNTGVPATMTERIRNTDTAEGVSVYVATEAQEVAAEATRTATFSSSQTGVGFLVAVGYGLPIPEGNNLLRQII